ncbi:outer membrane lipoprotein carrier protein LolA [Mesocricetibacter intestinalis]|uniref:Outer membrane lipoprotein carrier protein LolA n=1 Tax=Mesocricetibacter intestinalis TaxID=1521930 RepID=A0A4R6V867_9PAST|nr:outer membrane lipoprotein carrier protein LolA [Mesocricetibacter intestinalis]TDQ57675.1 outer membrane lipoprotein carrier protein LolA [Mesocricetibacter intestinalis]
MKKIFLLAAFLLFSPGLWAFSQAELIKTLQRPQNTQGIFMQQRFLASLSKPISVTGRFVLVKNKGLLWRMEKPFNADQRIRADGISQWNGTEWINAGQSSQNRQIALFLGLLEGNVSALENQFDLFLSGEPQNWTLVLKPSGLLMQQIFERIEIQGDDSVKRIELREKQGDVTLISFSEIKTDQPLDQFARAALE